MKIDGQYPINPEPTAPVAKPARSGAPADGRARVAAEERSTDADAAKALIEEPEAAKQVAEALNRQFQDNDVRFYVRDPNSVGVHNVVIEIRQGDKVVATIPPKEILRLAEQQIDVVQGKSITGMVVDQVG